MKFRKRLGFSLSALGFALGLWSASAEVQAQSTTDQASGASKAPGATLTLRLGRGITGEYLAATQAARNQDYKEAYRLFQRSHMLDPSDIDIRQQLLIFSIIIGDFKVAVEQAKYIVGDMPDHYISRMVLTTEAIHDEDYSQAQDHLKTVYDGQPKDILMAVLQGWTELGLGKVRKAISTVRGVPTEGAAEIMQNYHAALIADIGGWPKTANSRYSLAFNNKLSGLRVGELYINFLLRRGKTRTARSIKEDVDQRYRGEMLEVIEKRFELAKDQEKIVNSVPQGVAEAFSEVSGILLQEGNNSFSALYVQLARRLAPDLASAQLGLANIYFTVSRSQKSDLSEEALQLYRAFKPSGGQYRISQLQIGLIHRIREDADAADQLYQELREKYPDDSDVLLEYSNFLNAEERYEEAGQLLKSRVDDLEALTADDTQLVYSAGTSFERAMRWELAEPLLEKALELSPNNPLILNYLGYSWIDRAKNVTVGLAMIEKANELRPNEGFIIDSLGWAYYRMKRFHQAVELLEQAISVSPGDSEIQSHLGDAYWRVGRENEAYFQWRHALALEPSEQLLKALKIKLETGLQLTEEDLLPAEPIAPKPRPILRNR